ncbi:MAG: thiamine phosphate synthase [Cellvibrionaceae bacterium]
MITGLYAITNEECMQGESFAAKAEATLEGGCSLLQYRNKHLDFADKIQQGKLLRTLCDRYNARLIINDSIELAEIIRADGVHLGQDDETIEKARKALGSQAIIGSTCHDSLSLAQDAIKAGASYVAFGRFFPSQTKPAALPAPISLIAEAKKILNKPIVAIGGINDDNASQLIAAGVDSIAISNDLFSRCVLPSASHNRTIEKQTRLYQSLFNER